MVAVIGVLMAALLTVALKMRDLRRDLKDMNRSLDRLERRIDHQEAQLDEIRSALAESRGGGLEPIIDSWNALRSKGLVSALTLLGTHMFRTYLGKRRRKALPVGKATEP